MSRYSRRNFGILVNGRLGKAISIQCLVSSFCSFGNDAEITIEGTS